MKPKVICHIMCSVDGHIQVERWTKPADDTPKSELMKTYSEIGRTLSTDAWTFGKNTVCDIFPDKILDSSILLSVQQKENGVVWLRYKVNN